MTSDSVYSWIIFNIFVLGMLALDLLVFHRKAHAVSLREAFSWSVVWISLALIFNLGIYYLWGSEKAMEFLAGYLIEKSLSVDNIFVFIMIFSYFAVPAMYQHRVLFWGILGALIMRAIFIAAGAALLSAFHWIIYIFGGFLIITGVKMFFAGDEKIEPEKNPAVVLLRRWMPITKEFHGQRFFVRIDGRLWATPLFVVLLVIETTDVIFAVDSIPAIFAITLDPFIVYTSNIFAILGLRALYFLLAGILEMFRYLKVGLAFVLCFVGVKMMLVDFYKIPIGISLGVVAGILAISILASLVQPKLAQVPTSEPNPGHAPRKGPRRTAQVASRMRSKTGPVKPSILLAIVAVVLASVKWTSISSGPSADDAIVAIRVAQRDLFEAKQSQRALETPTFNDAEGALNFAWAARKEKRYEDAIVAARKVSHSVRVGE
ncbi:MAG: Integral rane protein TerC [Deltaproteobacteria bacterium]|nr:Integral rane protein TerC [Deltaproteobacteria bacterium]